MRWIFCELLCSRVSPLELEFLCPLPSQVPGAGRVGNA